MRIDITTAANGLNAIIGNLGESKNSRNAAITQINELSRQAGRNLRTA